MLAFLNCGLDLVSYQSKPEKPSVIHRFEEGIITLGKDLVNLPNHGWARQPEVGQGKRKNFDPTSELIYGFDFAWYSWYTSGL